MQYLVPQFIEVESKIIGPISGRQFVICLISLALCYLWFELFPAVIFIPLIFITGTIGGVFSFLKINGQAMHYFSLNLIQTLKRPRLTVWNRLPYEEPQKVKVKRSTAPAYKEAPSQSRLAAVSLMVDTGGAYVTEDVQRRAIGRGSSHLNAQTQPQPNPQPQPTSTTQDSPHFT